jgi:hypothetical protein
MFVSTFQLGQEFYTGDALLVISTVVSTNRLVVYNILQAGDIYEVDMTLNSDKSTFVETTHIPPFNDKTTVSNNIAYLYND